MKKEGPWIPGATATKTEPMPGSESGTCESAKREDHLRPDERRERGERLTPVARFKRDPRFAAMVSLLESFMYQAEFTPTEIREAAMLAAVNHDMRRSRYPMHLITGYGVVEPSVEQGSPPDVMSIDGVMYRRDIGTSPSVTENESYAEQIRRARDGV